MDYIFPVTLASNNVDSDENSTIKTTSYVSIYHDLSKIKRITKYSYDKDDEVWYWHLEELHASSLEQIKGISSIEDFYNWLTSTNLKGSNLLYEIIENFISSFTIIRINTVNLQNDQTNQKKVQKKIDEKTMQWIKSKMCIVEDHCYNLTNCDGTLKKISINKN